MEEIFNAIEQNADILHFRITGGTAKRAVVGQGFTTEDMLNEVAIAIENLNDGHYKILLGKYSNLSEQRAAHIFDFTKGQPTNPTKTMSTGRLSSQFGFSREDLEAAKQEGIQQGFQQAENLYIREKIGKHEARLDKIEDNFKKLVQILDEADGKADGNILEKGLDFMAKAKDGVEAFKDISL